MGCQCEASGARAVARVGAAAATMASSSLLAQGTVPSQHNTLQQICHGRSGRLSIVQT